MALACYKNGMIQSGLIVQLIESGANSVVKDGSLRGLVVKVLECMCSNGDVVHAYQSNVKDIAFLSYDHLLNSWKMYN